MESGALIAAAQSCGIQLNSRQGEQLAEYCQYLLAENKKQNLTRICTEEDVLYDHFIDSLGGVSVAGELPARQLLDLGSGAGFPGIPLKIYCPSLQLYLLEASGKKIDFLKRLVQRLGLEGVYFLHGRAEELGRGEQRETFPWVAARAVAPLVVLAELALPLLCRGGFFWAYKGPSAGAELSEAGEVAARCGGIYRGEIAYRLPHRGKERRILIFEKVGETEAAFPRRAGIPQKKPLRCKKKEGENKK